MRQMQTEIKIGEITYANDEIEFEAKLPFDREKLAAFIVRFWGVRCPDFYGPCLLCRQWRAFDLLTENPFRSPLPE